MRKIGVKTSTMKDALDFLEGVSLIEKVENPEVGLSFESRTTVKGEQALLQYYRLVTEYFTSDENEYKKGMLGLLKFFAHERGV